MSPQLFSRKYLYANLINGSQWGGDQIGNCIHITRPKREVQPYLANGVTTFPLHLCNKGPHRLLSLSLVYLRETDSYVLSEWHHLGLDLSLKSQWSGFTVWLSWDSYRTERNGFLQIESCWQAKMGTIYCCWLIARCWVEWKSFSHYNSVCCGTWSNPYLGCCFWNGLGETPKHWTGDENGEGRVTWLPSVWVCRWIIGSSVLPFPASV